MITKHIILGNNEFKLIKSNKRSFYGNNIIEKYNFWRIHMFLKTSIKQHYVNTESNIAFKTFTEILFNLIDKNIKNGFKSIVFVCIGTDRSTGDSLGPLIGYKISNMKQKNIFVHGCLEKPVHAKNLDEVMDFIKVQYNKPFIIAIDACLGRMDHVGYITIGEGPLKPGSGVNKELSPVGHINITGIVNFGGFMDFLVLQNTRLNVVMKMADLISTGIKFVSWKIEREPSISTLMCNVEA
jgi:putative sporulation protein YyaC